MEEKIIKVGGLNINLKTKGEGKPLLILHGWGSSSDKWQKTGELISEKGYKVIIPDLPGFGKSEEPKTPWNLDKYCGFVEELSQSLNLEKFCLLGHSFGGSLSIKYSLKNPGNVERLFLVASAGIREKSFRNRFLAKISSVLKVFAFAPFYDLFKKAFYKFVVKKSDYLYTRGVMRETYLNVIKEDLSGALSSISMPVIIIWGENDNVVPLKNAYLMKERINNSKLVIVPEGDHDLEQKLPSLLTFQILSNMK
jgi:pimeloyl-ACP methyl ester carboxylesterase